MFKLLSLIFFQKSVKIFFLCLLCDFSAPSVVKTPHHREHGGGTEKSRRRFFRLEAVSNFVSFEFGVFVVEVLQAQCDVGGHP